MLAPMTKQDIAAWRLCSHGLSGAPFAAVTGVVGWPGAVQPASLTLDGVADA